MQPDHNSPSGFSDRDRCFPCGMGGKMPGPKDWRSLVSEGTGTAHQCFGADSSAPSNSDLHKGEEASTHFGKNRQYYSQVLHQSYRGTHSQTLNAIALSIWNWCLERHHYANPPWCLILTALNKIRREEARIVLVAPVWKTQPWYPLLLYMLTDVPCLLPQREDLLISPSEREFIMPVGAHS